VAPALNNASTAATIVEQARMHVSKVIVVNDGSTDGTAEVLARLTALPDVEVITHAINLGKGVALLDGMQRAAALGCTHAITMDADGQHAPDELPRLLETIAAHPRALVIGTRDLSGDGRRPRKSRLLRAHSNFWVWTETGRWIADTQSGFRAYPLASVLPLALKTHRYDFEIETIVKLLWHDVPVVSVPVSAHYGPGSESSFRPFADFMKVAALNIKLLLQRMLIPKPARRLLTSRPCDGASHGLGALLRGMFLDERMSSSKLALSLGLGVCCGILPIWGFQLAIAVTAAHVLRLNKALALLGGNVSFPAAIPFILYASLATGRILLGAEDDASLDIASSWTFAREYLVGSVALAALAGTATGLAAYAAARLLGRREP